MMAEIFPLSPTQRRIQQNFQRGFDTYNDNAHMQQKIAVRLLELFKRVCKTRQFNHVLEIGCGTGFLTQELAQGLSVNHWTINDLVPDCETQIAPILRSRKCTWDFLSGPIENAILPAKCDLITSASAIQWVPDTTALLEHLSDSLLPGGWLVLSSFAPDHFHQLQSFGPDQNAMSYHDNNAWRDLLPNTLTLKYIGQETLTAKFPTVRDMLVHLRNTGVNAKTHQHWSRQDLIDFEQEYAQRFSNPDHSIPLTYAPVYIVAQKTEAA